ncbi:chemotaxis protein CheC [Sporolactobacillus sp. CPB3-1]|uniref:Chemotaxis protein CheC n=1 Tax=Sporolactobacillus mangiferae TaxID=2940498 RepID=A0ABT0M7L4_9BACL|nr:chemotaxis protein CheC [Sporolactobacillus mangiferae]MCL1630862.1 chemotaxis protein CheC [Sporolactobacillus mangiferae]
MYRISDLQPQHLDLLKESGNIGAAHAASALSMLLNKPIDMEIPSVRVLPIAEAMGADAENNVAASFIQVDGGLHGLFFMMFDIHQANALISELVPDGNVLDNGMGNSAFCEISNILCGSYLSALAGFLGISLTQSPPNYAVDMEGAILSEGLIELSFYDDSALIIDAVLSDREKGDKLNGEFLFLPFPDSLDVFFDKAEGKSFP